MDLNVSNLYSMFSTLVMLKIVFDGDESIFFNGKFLDTYTTYSALSLSITNGNGNQGCHIDRSIDQKTLGKE